MAATRLIAMHQNKGRSILQCLKDRIDYAMNGAKTDEGNIFLHTNALLNLSIWNLPGQRMNIYIKQGEDLMVM